MLSNWRNSPCFGFFFVYPGFPSPWNVLPLLLFSQLGCLTDATCQWVTTCHKIWLTCFMWHFNFLSVNQCGCCISLIAVPDWQLMIEPRFSLSGRNVWLHMSTQINAWMQVRPTYTCSCCICAHTYCQAPFSQDSEVNMRPHLEIKQFAAQTPRLWTETVYI